MVKIKTGMSADSSSDGEGGEALLTVVRDKLKIQQRLIDISARSLVSSRSSSADLSQSFESRSALEVQRENSSVQEVRRPLCRADGGCMLIVVPWPYIQPCASCVGGWRCAMSDCPFAGDELILP